MPIAETSMPFCSHVWSIWHLWGRAHFKSTAEPLWYIRILWHPAAANVGHHKRLCGCTFNSVQFNSIQFNSIQFNSIHMGCTMYMKIPFWWNCFSQILFNVCIFSPTMIDLHKSIFTSFDHVILRGIWWFGNICLLNKSALAIAFLRAAAFLIPKCHVTP
jgi:hypothetical protein